MSCPRTLRHIVGKCGICTCDLLIITKPLPVHHSQLQLKTQNDTQIESKRIKYYQWLICTLVKRLSTVFKAFTQTIHTDGGRAAVQGAKQTSRSNVGCEIGTKTSSQGENYNYLKNRLKTTGYHQKQEMTTLLYK